MGLPEARAGQTFSEACTAAALNAAFRAGWDNDRRVRQALPKKLIRGAEPLAVTIPARNDVGGSEAAKRFSAFAIGGPAFNPESDADTPTSINAINNLALKIVAPTPTKTKVAVYQKPCGSGFVEPVTVSGLTWARVWIKGNKAKTAGLSDDENRRGMLVAGRLGATIVWAPESTNEGEKLCLVCVESGGANPVFAMITGTDHEGKYSWREWGYDSDEGKWGEKAGGLTGSHTENDGFIIDVRGAKLIPSGVMVEAWPTDGVYSCCYDGNLLFGLLDEDVPPSENPLCGPGSVGVGIGGYNTTLPVYAFGPVYQVDGGGVGLHYMPANLGYDEHWVVIYQECGL